MPFVWLAIIAVMSLAPGYLLLRSLPTRTTRDLVGPRSLVPLSFALSLPIIAAIHFTSYLSGASGQTLDLLLYASVVGALFVAVSGRKEQRDLEIRADSVAFGLFLLYGLTLLMVTPSYETGFTADWSVYYPNTFAYLRKVPLHAYSEGARFEFLINRTPLLSLYGSFFNAVIGHTYAIFQVASLFQNALVFWAIYLVADRLYNRRAAVRALWLVPLAPAAVRGILVPEPKTAATFFLLLAAYYYTTVRDGREPERVRARAAMTAVCGAVAFMYHPSMLLYLVWMYVDQIYLYVKRRQPLCGALWLWTAIAGGCLVMPWYAWAFATMSGDATLRPTAAIAAYADMPIGRYLYTRLTMLASSTVAPFPLLDAIRQHGLDWLVPWSTGWAAHARSTGDYLLRFYEETLLGGLTVTGSVTLLLFGWRAGTRADASTPRTSMFVWMTLGALTCILVHVAVDDKGHARNLMTPLVILLLCHLGHLVTRLPALAVGAFFVAAIAEMFYTRFIILAVSEERATRLPDSVYHATRDVVSRVGVPVIALVIALLAVAYVRALRRTEA